MSDCVESVMKKLGWTPVSVIGKKFGILYPDVAKVCESHADDITAEIVRIGRVEKERMESSVDKYYANIEDTCVGSSDDLDVACDILQEALQEMMEEKRGALLEEYRRDPVLLEECMNEWNSMISETFYEVYDTQKKENTECAEAPDGWETYDDELEFRDCLLMEGRE